MKRWPVVRHIRYYYLNYQVRRAAYRWARVGIGLGFPNESDLKYLCKVWRGEI